HAVAIASTQKNKGSLEADNIVQAASTRVRFRLENNKLGILEKNVFKGRNVDLRIDANTGTSQQLCVSNDVLRISIEGVVDMK
ncbi:hypothetical protein Tco_1436487, partial [Tanacetum coccineum]